jgi:hypothetical protein
MVTLQRGELQYGGDIGRFEVRIVRENFLLSRATRQQLKYVFYPYAQAPDARPATHELGVDGNPVRFIHDELLMISLQNRASCRHASKRAQQSRSPIHQRGTP